MNKKRFIIFSFILIIIISIAYIVIMKDSCKIYINIKNDTEYSLKDLEIKFITSNIEDNNNKSIKVKDIPSHASEKLVVNTNEINGEGHIELSYIDLNGQPKEETIVGYLEGSYDGVVKVSITNSNNNYNLGISNDVTP